MDIIGFSRVGSVNVDSSTLHTIVPWFAAIIMEIYYKSQRSFLADIWNYCIHPKDCLNPFPRRLVIQTVHTSVLQPRPHN